MSNADKALPEISYTLAGIEYRGVFSTLAFCLMEEKTGKNALSKDIWQNINVSTVTVALWAALKTKNPDITLEFVRENLAMEDLASVLTLVHNGYHRASPPQEEDDSEKKSQAGPST